MMASRSATNSGVDAGEHLHDGGHHGVEAAAEQLLPPWRGPRSEVRLSMAGCCSHGSKMVRSTRIIPSYMRLVGVVCLVAKPEYRFSVHPAVERRQDQLVAGGVALVDGRQRGPGAPRDLAQLHRVVALGFEYLDDDVEDPVTLGGASSPASTPRCHANTPLPSVSNQVTVPSVTRVTVTQRSEDRWVLWTARSPSSPGWPADRAEATPCGWPPTAPHIIGVDICADIASNGYAMASRDELDETVALVEAEGGKMVGSVADVRDFHAVQGRARRGGGAVRSAGHRAGQCGHRRDGVSGADRSTRISNMWTDVLNVNLVGAYHTAKAAIPHLIAGGQGGSIVFTSSTAGLRGFGGLQGGGLGVRGVQARHRRADAHARQCACARRASGSTPCIRPR